MACADAQALLAKAQISEDDCAQGLQDFDALMESASADLRTSVASVFLRELMKTSPLVDEAEIDAVWSDARAEAAARVDAGELGEGRAAVQCPGAATPKGQAPPHGREVWCELSDGRRHGTAVTYNEQGEVVRRLEYVRGAIDAVMYFPPLRGALPEALFECPRASTRRRQQHGDTVTMECVDAQGNVTHDVTWKGGEISSISVDASSGSLGLYAVSNPSPEVEPAPATVPEGASVDERLALARSSYDEANGRPSHLERPKVLLESILAEQPDHIEALELMSQVHLELNDLDASLRTARRCTKAGPTMAGCWLTIAVIEETRGHPNEARTGYQRYLKHAPDGRYAKDARKGLARLKR